MTLKKIFRTAFPTSLWGGDKGCLWGLTLLTLLWFNFAWCLESSFNGWSTREFWSYNLSVATVLSMPIMLWQTRRWQAAIITLLSVLCEVNLMYSRTYFAAIPARSYLLAGNMADYSASAMQTLQWYDVGFLILTGMAWWLALRHAKSEQTSNTKPPKQVYFSYLIVLFMFSWIWDTVSPGYVKAFRQHADYKYYSQRIPMYTIFGWLTYDILATQNPLTTQDRQLVSSWLDEHKRLYPVPAVDTTRIYPHSVVLVYVESLETWPLELSVEGKEITPRLNRLLQDTTATYIPNVVTQTGPGRSIDTQLLENTGLLPMSTRVWATDRPLNKYYSVNQALAESNNADSWYLTTAKPSNWNQGATSQTLGYKHRHFKNDWKPGPTFGANHKRLGDKPLIEQTVALMQNGEVLPEGSPGFVHLITMTSHHPFMLPAQYDNLKLQGTYPEILKGYLETIHYTDAAIGQLIDYLQTRSDYKDILVVITGDHEGLANNREPIARQFSWVSDERLTPWIALNSPYPGKINKYVGQIDLYTTMLQLLGLNDYVWQGMGVSALHPRHPGVAISGQGNVSGPIEKLSSAEAKHLQDATQVSTLIVQHNLLQK